MEHIFFYIIRIYHVCIMSFLLSTQIVSPPGRILVAGNRWVGLSLHSNISHFTRDNHQFQQHSASAAAWYLYTDRLLGKGDEWPTNYLMCEDRKDRRDVVNIYNIINEKRPKGINPTCDEVALALATVEDTTNSDSGQYYLYYQIDRASHQLHIYGQDSRNPQESDGIIDTKTIQFINYGNDYVIITDYEVGLCTTLNGDHNGNYYSMPAPRSTTVSLDLTLFEDIGSDTATPELDICQSIATALDRHDNNTNNHDSGSIDSTSSSFMLTTGYRASHHIQTFWLDYCGLSPTRVHTRSSLTTAKHSRDVYEQCVYESGPGSEAVGHLDKLRISDCHVDRVWWEQRQYIAQDDYTSDMFMSAYHRDWMSSQRPASRDECNDESDDEERQEESTGEFDTHCVPDVIHKLIQQHKVSSDRNRTLHINYVPSYGLAAKTADMISRGHIFSGFSYTDADVSAHEDDGYDSYGSWIELLTVLNSLQHIESGETTLSRLHFHVTSSVRRLRLRSASSILEECAHTPEVITQVLQRLHTLDDEHLSMCTSRTLLETLQNLVNTHNISTDMRQVVTPNGLVAVRERVLMTVRTIHEALNCVHTHSGHRQATCSTELIRRMAGTHLSQEKRDEDAVAMFVRAHWWSLTLWNRINTRVLYLLDTLARAITHTDPQPDVQTGTETVTQVPSSATTSSSSIIDRKLYPHETNNSDSRHSRNHSFYPFTAGYIGEAEAHVLMFVSRQQVTAAQLLVHMWKEKCAIPICQMFMKYSIHVLPFHKRDRYSVRGYEHIRRVQHYNTEDDDDSRVFDHVCEQTDTNRVCEHTVFPQQPSLRMALRITEDWIQSVCGPKDVVYVLLGMRGLSLFPQPAVWDPSPQRAPHKGIIPLVAYGEKKEYRLFAPMLVHAVPVGDNTQSHVQSHTKRRAVNETHEFDFSAMVGAAYAWQILLRSIRLDPAFYLHADTNTHTNNAHVHEDVHNTDIDGGVEEALTRFARNNPHFLSVDGDNDEHVFAFDDPARRPHTQQHSRTSTHDYNVHNMCLLKNEDSLSTLMQAFNLSRPGAASPPVPAFPYTNTHANTHSNTQANTTSPTYNHTNTCIFTHSFTKLFLDESTRYFNYDSGKIVEDMTPEDISVIHSHKPRIDVGKVHQEHWDSVRALQLQVEEDTRRGNGVVNTDTLQV
jgi:hypothetical protein